VTRNRLSASVIIMEIDAYRAALKRAVLNREADLAKDVWTCVAAGLFFGFGMGRSRSLRPQYIPLVVERYR
jgi:hypothetical protein